MKRQKGIFPLVGNQAKFIKERMLSWSQQFSILLFLDSNNYESTYGRYECLLAVDPIDVVSGKGDGLDHVSEWFSANQDWLFGHISYDHKNSLETYLVSSHPVRTGFPELSFFCPRIVCFISKDEQILVIEAIDTAPGDVFKEIMGAGELRFEPLRELQFLQRINKEDYLSSIKSLQRHIVNGDCYEINFCNEGYHESIDVDPLNIFKHINELSPAPFAAYYRLDDKYAICASPERYLLKTDRTILSQPIKGTAKRDKDKRQDNKNIANLRQSIKDKAENVMIVDLVRSDLARSCEVGTIRVEELFGIYSFPQVHQMISTVRGILLENSSLMDPVKYSFPMGSMTGAPKIKVMEIIEKYERARRDLFSGTIGYITPDGNFDFNVVIRSMFYNANNGYLCYQTGGAITYDSDPQQEWEEMRLKAWAIERIFGARE